MNGAGQAPQLGRPRPRTGRAAPVPSPGHRSSRVGLVIWGVALAAGTALFHAMANGPLGPPPLRPSGWAPWADGRDPLVATVAVLRLGVLALSWYLVGVTSVGILARLLRAARLIRLADALTIPALRRLLQGALGVSLATMMAVGAPPAPTHRDAASVTLKASEEDRVPDPTARSTITLASADQLPAPPRDQVTLGHVDDATAELAEDERSPRGRPLPLELADPSSRGPEPPVDEVEDAVAGRDLPSHDGEHRVIAGDSFWTIAEDVLAASLGRTPSETATFSYWQEVVAANRSRLVDPENPDLIFPDQVLVLPRPSGDAS